MICNQINRILAIHNERERLKDRRETMWTVALFLSIVFFAIVFMCL